MNKYVPPIFFLGFCVIMAVGLYKFLSFVATAEKDIRLFNYTFTCGETVTTFRAVREGHVKSGAYVIDSNGKTFFFPIAQCKLEEERL